jgi:hypothetical protein
MPFACAGIPLNLSITFMIYEGVSGSSCCSCSHPACFQKIVNEGNGHILGISTTDESRVDLCVAVASVWLRILGMGALSGNNEAF